MEVVTAAALFPGCLQCAGCAGTGAECGVQTDDSCYCLHARPPCCSLPMLPVNNNGVKSPAQHYNYPGYLISPDTIFKDSKFDLIFYSYLISCSLADHLKLYSWNSAISFSVLYDFPNLCTFVVDNEEEKGIRG